MFLLTSATRVHFFAIHAGCRDVGATAIEIAKQIAEGNIKVPPDVLVQGGGQPGRPLSAFLTGIVAPTPANGSEAKEVVVQQQRKKAKQRRGMRVIPELAIDCPRNCDNIYEGRSSDRAKEVSGMPELPKTLQRSDTHAREVWLKTLESAIETYGGDNGRSRRVAFASLKHQYEKKGNRWVRKAHKGPSDPQAARGPTTKHKSTEEPRAPTALGKVAKTAEEAQEKAKEARREYSAERAKEKKRR